MRLELPCSQAPLPLNRPKSSDLSEYVSWSRVKFRSVVYEQREKDYRWRQGHWKGEGIQCISKTKTRYIGPYYPYYDPWYRRPYRYRFPSLSNSRTSREMSGGQTSEVRYRGNKTAGRLQLLSPATISPDFAPLDRAAKNSAIRDLHYNANAPCSLLSIGLLPALPVDQMEIAAIDENTRTLSQDKHRITPV